MPHYTICLYYSLATYNEYMFMLEILNFELGPLILRLFMVRGHPRSSNLRPCASCVHLREFFYQIESQKLPCISTGVLK